MLVNSKASAPPLGDVGPRFAISLGLFAFALGLAVLSGYRAGVHQRISTQEWGRSLFAIGSAISANVYGLPRALYFEPVINTLKEAGLTDDVEQLRRVGASYPNNLFDGVLINKAIE